MAVIWRPGLDHFHRPTDMGEAFCPCDRFGKHKGQLRYLRDIITKHMEVCDGEIDMCCKTHGQFVIHEHSAWICQATQG